MKGEGTPKSRKCLGDQCRDQGKGKETLWEQKEETAADLEDLENLFTICIFCIYIF